MGLYNWRNKADIWLGMRHGDHDPVNSRTLNRGRGGAALDAVWPAAPGIPTKLGTRHGYSFDGGDHLNLGTTLSFGDGAGNDQPFSICWCGVVTVAAAASMLSKFNGDTSDGEYQITFVIDGRIAFYCMTSNISDRIARIAPAGTLQTGTTCTIVATYDGTKSSNGIAIYHNAIRVDTSNSDGGAYAGMVPSVRPLTVYARELNAGYDRYVTGSLYELGVVPLCLTPHQVAQYHREALAGLHTV